MGLCLGTQLSQQPAGLGALPRARASTHTPAQRWLALWGSLPAGPGCGKHHFFHIPSFNSSTSSQKYSHHPASCSLAVSHLRLLTTSHLSLCWLCPLDAKSHPPLCELVFMWNLSQHSLCRVSLGSLSSGTFHQPACSSINSFLAVSPKVSRISPERALSVH